MKDGWGAFLAGLVSLFNKFFDLFKKGPTEKAESKKDDAKDDDKKFKETGRPGKYE